MNCEVFDDIRRHEAGDLALQAELLGHGGARELYRRAAVMQ